MRILLFTEFKALKATVFSHALMLDQRSMVYPWSLHNKKALENLSGTSHLISKSRVNIASFLCVLGLRISHCKYHSFRVTASESSPPFSTPGVPSHVGASLSARWGNEVCQIGQSKCFYKYWSIEQCTVQWWVLSTWCCQSRINFRMWNYDVLFCQSIYGGHLINTMYCGYSFGNMTVSCFF